MRFPSWIPRLLSLMDNNPWLTRGILVALAVRLALLPWFSDPLNFRGFHLTTSLVAGGWDPWTLIRADPALAQLNPWGYPPIFLLFTLAAFGLSFGNGVVFGILVRLPLVAADLLTGVVLYRIGRACGRSQDLSATLALGYWFNPFVILVSTIWGTTDPLPVLCVAVATYYVLRQNPRRDIAALSLGLGIAFKLYPAVLVPVFFGALTTWRARFRFAVLAALPLVVTSAPVLVASPAQYLTTLAGFTYAAVTAGTDQNTLYALAASLGVAGPSVVLVALALYAVLLGFLTRAVHLGRMHLVVAATAALLGVYLFAPRYNQNYFLWPISLLAVSAVVLEWPTPWRQLARWAWVPLTADALIYNGAFGITGLFYWSFISLGQAVPLYRAFPMETHHVLAGIFLVCVGASVLSLWFVSRGRRYGWRWRIERVRPRRWGPRSEPLASRIPIAVLVAAVAILVVGSALVAVGHRAVAPEDFSAYDVSGTRVSVEDNFNAAFLEFTWTFGGTGGIVTRPAQGTLLLDTLRGNDTAWIERALPQTEVRANYTLAVDRVDGPNGILFIAQVPRGWIAVANTTRAPKALNYTLEFVWLSRLGLQSVDLGSVALGKPLTLRLDVSPESSSVQYGANKVFMAASGDPVSIQFGSSRASGTGGGLLAIDRIDLSWKADFPPTPLFSPTLITLSAGVLLVVPALIVRDWRRPQ